MEPAGASPRSDSPPAYTPRHANLARLVRKAGDTRIEEVLDACGGNVELAVDYMLADLRIKSGEVDQPVI